MGMILFYIHIYRKQLHHWWKEMVHKPTFFISPLKTLLPNALRGPPVFWPFCLSLHGTLFE